MPRSDSRPVSSSGSSRRSDHHSPVSHGIIERELEAKCVVCGKSKPLMYFADMENMTCRDCDAAVRELRVHAKKQQPVDILTYVDDLGKIRELVRDYKSTCPTSRGGRRMTDPDFDLRLWFDYQQPADTPIGKRCRTG